MRVLELFAGSRSIGKVAEELGHQVFSVDINNFKDIDLAIDILDLDKHKLMEEMFKKGIDDIDFIWASPPCTFFSVASIGHHWHKNHTPKTKEAIIGLKILNKTLLIFDWFKDAKFFMENPVGKMRRIVKGIDRVSITYCSYGDIRMKPTDIWSNNIYDIFNTNGWKPRAKCFAGNKKCHHEEAPRGSSTGTQGIKGNYERSKIPYELCKEILTSSFL